MQIHFNLKNCGFCLIAAFFVYLIYLLIFGSAANPKLPNLSVDIKDLINYCIVAAESGGHAIRQIHKEGSYWKKSKGKTGQGTDELLTKADLVSNEIIREHLERAPGLQVVSEEKKTSLDEKFLEKYKQNNYKIWAKHKNLVKLIDSQAYSLSDVAVWVDPLDATQEFTEDLLQYVTVTLCVTFRGKPVFGVIHRPFVDQTVWGLVGYGVVPNVTKPDQPLKTFVVSRTHAGKVSEFLNKALNGERFKVEPAGGSGYKSLRVLNGSASLYIHLTSIKKWDLCAADAIIRAADGRMTTMDGNELTYFVKDTRVNDRGLVVSLGEQHFYYLSKFSPVWNDGRLAL